MFALGMEMNWAEFNRLMDYVCIVLPAIAAFLAGRYSR